MEGSSKELCAFCGTFNINSSESGRRQFLNNFNSEFVVPFCVSISGGVNERVLLGGKEVPDNWSVCGRCLPDVRRVLGLKEKVDLMEGEVRELQMEILKRMNSLLEEVERMCEGMGEVWGLMAVDGGGTLRKKFRGFVGSVLLDLQHFREETSQKLLRRGSTTLPSTKSTKITESPPLSSQDDSDVIMEVDLISDTESQGSENDVQSEPLSPPIHNSPLDSNLNEEADEISGDGESGDFEPEAEELDINLEDDFKEEEVSEDEDATSEEEEVDISSSEESEGEENTSSENEEDPPSKTTRPTDVQKDSNENAHQKDNPYYRPLIREYRPKRRPFKVDVRQRLITKITEGQSIATSLNLPTSPSDDPRRNYAIQYNSETESFHLSGIEIKYIDDRSAFQCTACGVICTSLHKRVAEEIIFDHILGMHLKVYKCPYCKDPHFSRNHGFFIAHIREFHLDIFLTCDICGKRENGPGNLKKHKWSHLSKEEKEDPANSHMKPSFTAKKKPPPPRPCLCPQCGKQLTSVSINQHLKTHAEDRKKLKCSDCNRSFLQQGYRLHIKNGCPWKKKVGTPCPVCGTSFRSRMVMFKHLKKAHPEERLYPCEICGKRLKTEPEMLFHKKKHFRPEEKHVCEKCGVVLKFKKSLKYHMERVCGKVKKKRVMNMSRVWEKKMQEPVELRPFPCDVCQRRFKCRSTLHQHKREQHSIEGGKHGCGTCGRRYVHPANLRKHRVKCGGGKGE